MNMAGQFPQDEIDLVDVWLAFKRHYRSFLLVFAGMAVLGIAAVLLKPVQYDYATTIKIGGVREGGQFQLLESPEAVKAELESVHLPRVLAAYEDQGESLPGSLLQPEIAVPKGGNVVTIKASGGPEDRAWITRILGEVAASLVAAHDEVLQTYLQKLRALLQNQIAEAQARIASLEQSRQAVLQGGDMPSQAMTVLMLDSQLEAARSRLANLERELEVGLATNIRQTELARPPAPSLEPSGPGTLVLMALVLVLAGFAACFAVFLRAFQEVARQRERNESEQGAALNLTEPPPRVRQVG